MGIWNHQSNLNDLLEMEGRLYSISKDRKQVTSWKGDKKDLGFVSGCCLLFEVRKPEHERVGRKEDVWERVDLYIPLRKRYVLFLISRLILVSVSQEHIYSCDICVTFTQHSVLKKILKKVSPRQVRTEVTYQGSFARYVYLS